MEIGQYERTGLTNFWGPFILHFFNSSAHILGYCFKIACDHFLPHDSKSFIHFTSSTFGYITEAADKALLKR